VRYRVFTFSRAFFVDAIDLFVEAFPRTCCFSRRFAGDDVVEVYVYTAKLVAAESMTPLTA
jgi:hypothetical protein